MQRKFAQRGCIATNTERRIGHCPAPRSGWLPALDRSPIQSVRQRTGARAFNPTHIRNIADATHTRLTIETI